ncbi:hypothetical protein ATANTOWER_032802 [Ataeniobius toweri]|uniref:Uncharacterized protein n=1 Tax=Ataeniobius toweri TaxID=208326 RepID=A0ABU7BPS2_9TELE|nr:hypothetical protein [Ataeniobius toweri]
MSNSLFVTQTIKMIVTLILNQSRNNQALSQSQTNSHAASMFWRRAYSVGSQGLHIPIREDSGTCQENLRREAPREHLDQISEQPQNMFQSKQNKKRWENVGGREEERPHSIPISLAH